MDDESQACESGQDAQNGHGANYDDVQLIPQLEDKVAESVVHIGAEALAPALFNLSAIDRHLEILQRNEFIPNNNNSS